MLMLVLISLTQGHSESAKAKTQRCMLSATKQEQALNLLQQYAIFLHDLDLDFANIYMACPACFD